MKIFGKHIFRSIRANPKQPLLIVLTVSLCVAVMILSVALPVSIYRNEHGRMLADELTADVEVSLKATSERRLISLDTVAEAIGDRGRVIGEFALTGFYTSAKSGEKSTVSIGAFNLQDAHDFYKLQYIEYGKFTNNNLDRSAIVSVTFADEHGISLGDTVKMNVLGEEFSYTVEAIALENGIMKRESVLVDISSIRAALSERSPIIASLPGGFSPYTKAQIRLNDGVDSSQVKSELEALEAFADKKIELPKDSSSDDYIATLLAVTALIPAVLLVIVAIMMTVSTFDLLQKKRADDLELFRTVGADESQINRILYFESGIYGVIGALIGSVLSVPLMRAVNNLYSFRYSPMRFGFDDALIGIVSSVGFVALCTWVHIAKQRRKSATERLSSTNLDTDRLLKRKNIVFALPILLLSAVTILLPVQLKYAGAFLLLFATVIFIYVISRYVVGLFASMISSALAKGRRGAGDFILAAKSCENSYPLRHAGRITTVLLTVFITLGAILSAASGEITAFVDITSVDYVGVMVDSVTIEKIKDVEGVLAVAEASMKANAVFEGGKASTGLAVSGDISECFDLDAMPKNMPSGNSAAVSCGISRMLGVEVGDTVKCEIGGVPCELVIIEIVNTHGDFIYYDADSIGSGYDMLCISTDGSADTYERMSAIFDERGVECLTKDEYFSFAENRINPQLTIFRAMLYTMIALTFIAVLNVLAEQRMARAREFEIMMQNGKTRRGVVSLQATEILYLVIFSLVMSLVFSHVLYFIVDRAVISFGMTLYV